MCDSRMLVARTAASPELVVGIWGGVISGDDNEFGQGDAGGATEAGAA